MKRSGLVAAFSRTQRFINWNVVCDGRRMSGFPLGMRRPLDMIVAQEEADGAAGMRHGRLQMPSSSARHCDSQRKPSI
jgi:hypothetical protein